MDGAVGTRPAKTTSDATADGPPAAMGGVVVWLTGLPSSGKTTLAESAAAALRARGQATLVLDGDAVRAALVPAPGYDEAGREAFYATLARLAALAARQGLTVLVPATAHRRCFRDVARALAPARFVEVFVDTDLATCRARDSKGLYAAPGPRGALPGAGVRYEPPEHPDVRVRPSDDGVALLRAALEAP
jgi:adenylylsulfate kinase